MEKEQKVDEKKEIRRCPRCNSSFGYLRIKTKEWICRSCGYKNTEVVV